MKSTWEPIPAHIVVIILLALILTPIVLDLGKHLGFLIYGHLKANELQALVTIKKHAPRVNQVIKIIKVILTTILLIVFITLNIINWFNIKNT